MIWHLIWVAPICALAGALIGWHAVWAVPALLASVALLDLFVLRSGQIHVPADGGKFGLPPALIPFRIRRGSWLNRITGAQGTTIHQLVHFVENLTPSPWLVAHEYGHILKQRETGWTYYPRRLFSPAFRAADEKHSDEFAARWMRSPFFVNLSNHIYYIEHGRARS